MEKVKSLFEVFCNSVSSRDAEDLASINAFFIFARLSNLL